jgi:hypothetical protein
MRHLFRNSATLGLSVHAVGRGQEEIGILRSWFTHRLISALAFGCNIPSRTHAGASTLEAVVTS